MNTKHTPGPWTAEGSETTLATWVEGPDGRRICTMRRCVMDWGNAVLTAAGPDMLEALEAILFALDLDSTRALAEHEAAYKPLREAARAAIAKAKQGE